MGGQALAEAFAKSASTSFDSQNQGEKRATDLEAKAKSLRGRSAMLVKTAGQEVAKAAAKAAAEVLTPAEADVRGLLARAAELTQEAVERRKNAQDAMKRVTVAQAALRGAMPQA